MEMKTKFSYASVNASVETCKNGNPVLVVYGEFPSLYGRKAVEAVVSSAIVPNRFKIEVMNIYLEIERDYPSQFQEEESSEDDSEE